MLISSNGLAKLAASNSNRRGEGIFWTCDPSVELPIRISEDPKDIASQPPITVMAAFERTVAAFPNKVAMRAKRKGAWRDWTWRDYYEDSKSFAKSCIHPAVGLKPHQGVAIIGFNSPEWLIADIGAIFAGGLASGMYTTNGAEACHYIVDHCEAGVVVVEDAEQLAKILEIRGRLPLLKAIVQYSGEPPKEPGVYSWHAFLQLGKEVPDAALEARMRAQKPGECCTLIYTSGTTGPPKAVMLSHDNITWTAQVAAGCLGLTTGERVVSYLPLSHIAAQITDIHAPMLLAGTVSFAQPDALKGSLVETLNEVRPTAFLGVPRVWEKIEEKMRSVGAANTGIKKKLGDWAKGVGLQSNQALLEGKGEVAWGYSFAKSVVFSNVKKALGMDQCHLRATGAAPISLNTMHYFMSLDMPLYELYGMSESSGPHTCNVPSRGVRMGTVGKVMDGAENWIDDGTPYVPANKRKSLETGKGEICMRGRHVFMGYMKNVESTMATLDENGFLHSGDIGQVDKDGFLRITGRIKELIITAGGENVPPVLIEDTIKAELMAVSNAMVIGDKRKYLSVVLTLKTEPDKEGLPTNVLAAQAAQLAKEIGSEAKTTQEAIACPKFKAAIEKAIDRTNAKATSKAQNIQKWTLLANDFSIPGGELTPTMKLKRAVTAEKYSAAIEAMYPPQSKL